MSQKRYKWTRDPLMEELSIDLVTLTKLIELGQLQPDGIDEDDNWNHFRHTEFERCQWFDDDVQRYREIAGLVQSQHLYFYNEALKEIRNIESRIMKEIKLLHNDNKTTREILYGIEKRFVKQERMLTGAGFREIIGMPKSTFYNNVHYLDATKKVMSLATGNYQSLVWWKTGNDWIAPESDFWDIKSRQNYDVVISERKSTGDFTPKKIVKVDEL